DPCYEVCLQQHGNVKECEEACKHPVEY
uniref:Potassium channel toxin kappa-KTx 2.2 n=1 Tax=Opisthacanthus madagascariensis TaxID=167108 RepID=KKX21_OPIMA|nr:RecName: Full=Potassium channel toxin kappa-KTx 2.2; AltName: Full=Toxin OmTx2; Contains: RecName: Full=Potassium channel toxin kappa-KTx 2.1; AltName: Full=Toxin OmTx1; Contains: RecName: Full=Potassium channel toxin kappa-KTx 2.4; AltName: Full=Toxin OmTx4 [Opisthacanthus madagascariensis]1WQD_A Chain A, OmTx2 [Opisthacanthus madagascariensis]